MKFKNLVFLVGAIACLAASGAAQNPRASQVVSSATGAAEGIAVACDDDCSAILWKDATDDSNWVTVSDGTGKTWSTSVRIDDSPGGGKFNGPDSIAISGDNIYAAYRDERNSTDDDVYFTVSKDKGATWSADVLLDKGFPTGANPVRNYAMDADGDVVAVLIAVENAATGDEELYFVCSTDCGTTWTSAIAATTHNGGGIPDIDEIDMEVEGSLIHMAWRDNFARDPSDDVYYSCYDCSSGAFVTQDALVSVNMATALGDADDQVELSVDNGTVAVVFLVDDINGTPEELWINLSSDCGATWCGDRQIGSYTLGTDDCDNPWIFVNNDPTCPTLIVAWEDNRTGSDEAYYASFDLTSGCPVLVNEAQLSLSGAGFPRIAGGGDYVAISWSEGAFPNSSGAACSRDAGRTFGAGFTVSDNSGDVDFSELAYCERYCNFINVWLSDDSTVNEAFAGGFRHQTVSSDDVFTSGATINFDIAGFGKAEAGDFFAVLVSATLGGFFLPDGRNTCLGSDPFLSQTIALAQALSPIVTGTLSASGTGSTANATLPTIAPGTELYFMAVSFASQTDLGCITDVNSVTVQ